MGKYLIVGLPGIGKSTLIRELQQRGQNAQDGDDITTLSVWKNRHTGALTRHRDPAQTDWNEHHDWVWNLGELTRLLDLVGKSDYYLCGNAQNVSDCYTYFDEVFALSGDNDLLEQRLRARGRGYGSNPDELAAILEWNEDFAANERSRGATLVSADATVTELAEGILELSHAR